MFLELDRMLAEDETQDGKVAEVLSDSVSTLRRIAMRDDSAERFLPHLLLMLAKVRRRSGHAEAALPLHEENVAICRSRLATSPNPQDQAILAHALAEMARTLFRLDRHHESLASAQEAVTHIRAAGALGHPIQNELAEYLALLRQCLFALDRYEEGLAVAQEAVSVEAQLRLVDPTGDPTRLVEALNKLARCLAFLDRYPAAAAATREAVIHLRRLVAEGSANAQYELADALESLRFFFACQRDNPSEQLAAAQEAVTLRRQLPVRPGTRDAVDLANALRNLAFALANGHQDDQVTQIAGEAIMHYRPLAGAGLLEHTDRWLFADVVGLYRHQCVAARQYQAALAPAREQVALYRQLANERPGTHREHLADAIDDLADLLAATGQHAEATAAHDEAAAIRSTKL